MAKRVFEIAKELGIKSKAIVDKCRAEGIPESVIKNHMSTASAGLEATFREWFSAGAGEGGWAPPPGVELRTVDSQGNLVDSGCPVVGATRQLYFLRGTAQVNDCLGWEYGYGDSLYADSLYEREEDSWWRRLRERLFDDERQDTMRRTMPPHDTIIIGTPPRRRSSCPISSAVRWRCS